MQILLWTHTIPTARSPIYGAPSSDRRGISLTNLDRPPQNQRSARAPPIAVFHTGGERNPTAATLPWHQSSARRPKALLRTTLHDVGTTQNSIGDLTRDWEWQETLATEDGGSAAEQRVR
jgi:hypothetical protein